MTTESSTPQAKNFVNSVLPWLLAAAMLAVYLITLDHWVTPYNLGEVVEVSGWNHGAHLMGPLLFLVTYPLHWIPVGTVPLALNLFTALCAVLTLAQLARSVALLPHDRTYEQRQREQSEFSFLSNRFAWIPPLFAVLACGLQMTFWESAIDATGTMFDLLIFAFAARCLLEYRVMQNESWLVRLAVVYGLGMANNWAMVAFFPAFLVALIWIKGLSFFNLRFLLRTAGCGLAGLMLFFLFPLVTSIQHTVQAGFWTQVHATFSADKMYFSTFPRQVLVVLGLTSLLPVLVIGMRWSSYFGDNSPLGILVATAMFHIIHALFFLSCIWVMLDAPISPRVMGLGFSFMPLYYLSALCIGYFSGYFLLIFGTPMVRSKSAPNPLLRVINVVVTCCVLVLLIALPLVLVRKNLPTLQTEKADCHEIERYFSLVEQELPQQGAVVLCDDPAAPYSFRLEYLEATLHRGGKSSPHLLVSASALTHDATYPAFLQKRNPEYQVPTTWTNLVDGEPASLDVIRLLDKLSQKHPLYYIHPSFGYFFERFYAEPQGLVCKLQRYPVDGWDAPLLTPAQIASNEAFWKQTFADVLPPLIEMVNPTNSPAKPGAWEKFMTKLHLKPEKDKLSLPLGAYYSRTLDNWGVELERAGHIEEAGKTFVQAVRLNPGNASAAINYGFNKKLTSKKEIIVQPPKDLEDKLGPGRNWLQLLTVDGPIDEPNCRDEVSTMFANGGNYRQVVQNFNRIKELSPENLRVRLQLAELLIYTQMYTNGLTVLLPYDQGFALAYTNADEVLKKAPDDPTGLFLKSVALMELQLFDQAIEPLNRLIAVQPNNYQALLDRAICNFKMSKLAAAKPDYEAVLKANPKVYQASFGLATIAQADNDTPAAIKHFETYLANAPTNSAEAAFVTAHLKELKSGKPAP